MINEIIKNIRNMYPSLPKAKKVVANYFLNNYDSIPFETINELASEINVSDTTIINFCQDLGFGGFSDFKHAVTKHVQNEMSTSHKLSTSAEALSENDPINIVMKQEITNIQITLSNEENMKNIYKLLDLLNQASAIHTLGFRSSALLAQLFCYILRQQNRPIDAIIPSFGDYVDKLMQVKKGDLVIAFNFMRYSRVVLQAIEYLKSKDVSIVLITDMGPSPARQHADLTFSCLTKSYSFVDSYSSCLSLISAIVTLSSLDRRQETETTLASLEELFDKFKIFGEDLPRNYNKLKSR